MTDEASGLDLDAFKEQYLEAMNLISNQLQSVAAKTSDMSGENASLEDELVGIGETIRHVNDLVEEMLNLQSDSD
jgi:archaellum component FlaC